MHAGKTFESRITCHFKRHPILGPQFLQLGHDAISNARCAFSVQAIHHGFNYVELILYGKIDKVGVDEDLVGWGEGGVVLEEEGRGSLFTKKRKKGG